MCKAARVVGTDVKVVAAAVVSHGRVLAARRVRPVAAAGGWELPGGKVEPEETTEDAVVREVREELGCMIEVLGSLDGKVTIRPGLVLVVRLARLVEGEPVPHEHDAVRWLGPEEFDDVSWLPADAPFLPQLRTLLLDGERLEGGNVSGAVRIGRSVRRAAGPWSGSVHTLLEHLRASGLVEVPDVFGYDERGREVLTYLPGRVPDVVVELIDEQTLADGMRWLRRFHSVAADWRVQGRWRTVSRPMRDDEIICHHDFAPYNVTLSTSADGERLTGVFDWDMAGPGHPVDDLAFAAWNWVPLTRDIGPELTARRLRLIASAYDGGIRAAKILDHVPARIQRSLDLIGAGQRAGDPGMVNLGTVGEPERSARTLAQLIVRIPAIRLALAASS